MGVRAGEGGVQMKRKYATPQQTEDAAREWIEHEVKQGWDTEDYRGYKLICAAQWKQGSYDFRVLTYMKDSPLAPNGIMFVDFDDVNDWRDYFGPTGTAVASNTALSLKRMIDIAYDKPERFTPSQHGIVLSRL